MSGSWVGSPSLMIEKRWRPEATGLILTFCGRPIVGAPPVSPPDGQGAARNARGGYNSHPGTRGPVTHLRPPAIGPAIGAAWEALAWCNPDQPLE